ncbi:MAG TPA: cytochrome c-type biogenesis protein [Alphaproteobacteria bacterium]|nr:cytochrome c-type biogenesis protein [Alphaproteobacteria bacterium]
MMRRVTSAALGATLCFAAALIAQPALAVLPSEMLKDPALETRAEALSKNIRCQVCQNEDIDDSAAPLAADMRRLIREKILTGQTDQQILDFLVQRYGDNVLMRPPIKPATWLLWFGPAALLIVTGTGIAFAARRRTAPAAPAQLAPDEERRLRDIMERKA